MKGASSNNCTFVCISSKQKMHVSFEERFFWAVVQTLIFVEKVGRAVEGSLLEAALKSCSLFHWALKKRREREDIWISICSAANVCNCPTELLKKNREFLGKKYRQIRGKFGFVVYTDWYCYADFFFNWDKSLVGICLVRPWLLSPPQSICRGRPVQKKEVGSH